MNQLQRILVVIVFALFAGSLRVMPQAVSANAQVNLSSTVETGPVVPSHAIRRSGTPVLGDQAAVNAGRPKTANTGTRSGLARADSVPRGPSWLSFEPGIGWQSVAISAPMSMETPGALGMPNCTSEGKETKNSATSGTSKSECGPSAGAKTARGTSKWPNTKSVPNPASGAASQRHVVGFDSAPVGNLQASASSRSGIPDGEIAALKTKAYSSSIKLRIMMRNAPDLQTRIELRELLDSLTKGSRVATGIAKKDKTRTGELTNEPRHNAYLSSKLVGHGRATDSARRRPSKLASNGREDDSASGDKRDTYSDR
jgi:hypothetical protein